jgi:predicted O-methyltransferase YrrM
LWSVPRSTGEFLKFLVGVKSATTILEIGTSAGYSAIWLALGAIQTLGHVYTIDIFEPKIELAKKQIENAELEDWITILPGEARKIAEDWDREIDLLFLDADKENYLEYFHKLMPFLKPGGLIVADNAVDYGYLMKDYIDEVTHNAEVESYLLTMDNGLMMTFKK